MVFEWELWKLEDKVEFLLEGNFQQWTSIYNYVM